MRWDEMGLLESREKEGKYESGQVDWCCCCSREMKERKILGILALATFSFSAYCEEIEALIHDGGLSAAR